MINPSPEWAKTLRYFWWKSYSNTSDRQYELLLAELPRLEHQIQSIKVTWHYLQAQLRIYIQEHHCCISNCMVFIGSNFLRWKCQFCHIPRFVKDNPPQNNGLQAEFFPNEEVYQCFLSLKLMAIYSYIPLIPRLKLLYANPNFTAKMRYPTTLLTEPWHEGFQDI